MNAAKSSLQASGARTCADDKLEFSLAHFSDPHLTSVTNVKIRELLNKRIFGYLSWLKRRRLEHRTEVLEALLRDLEQIRPNHTVITGDLTHLGLPLEFEQARTWLQSVGSPVNVTVIPGNHEAYVKTASERTLLLWEPYMVSDAPDAGSVAHRVPDPIFPSLRVRGPLAIIGLSSARPSGLFLATGSLGRAQLSALEQIMESSARRGLIRVLLIHHPPLPGTVRWRKRLTDGGMLRRLIERQGVELVLHGHGHRAALGRLETKHGTVPVIGVPSASAISVKPGRRAQYHLYRFRHSRDCWKLTMDIRSYVHGQDKFVPEMDRTLVLPRPFQPR